jgi:hydroxymethylglutaryl-CoA lyase
MMSANRVEDYGPTTYDGLPRRVTVYEVGPRDGLQNESGIVPVAVKAAFISRLINAGHRVVETTSLVHPDWVPQLADAEKLIESVGDVEGVRLPVLVPNERGLERALALGVRDIAVFGSATETFARRNLNTSVDKSLSMFAPLVGRARAEGLGVRGYLSMCFGDPWEGEVPVARVVDIAGRMMGLGCTELSISDTIGVATPGRVVALLKALVDSGISVSRIAVHFHDTYGQALANTLAALHQGVTIVDAAAGGLGGCPFAGSATGNLATEDLLWHLHGLGIETGIDLGKMVDTSIWLAGELGRPSPSKVVAALAK